MSPAASLDAYPPARHDLHVEHYDLDLRYSPASNRLSGRATLRVTAGQSAEEGLERVRLDLHRLRVTRVRVDGEPARHTHHGPTLTVLLPRALAAGGAATVLVEYAGRPTPAPSPWGPVGWEELADGALAANQPTGARSWFPCLDEPGDRATYRTSVTVDQPYRAVAHGVLVSTTRGAGTTTFVYDEPRPTPTYLATVQVGRYEAYPIPVQGVPQQVVTAPAIARSVRASLELQGPLMAHHESVFGPYPFAGYTLVVTPDALEIPLEAQGMAIFGANHLHGEARRLLAHELAHQWFGNAVSVATWQHIWLNEGPACYAEWLWSAASGGPSEHTLARTWHRRLAVQPQDLVLADPGYRRIFDDRVYKRGALTCYALDVLLGRPAFSALLRSWVAERAGTSVTSDDFRAHVRAAAGRLGPRADALLGAWLDRPELPPLPSA